MRVTFVLPGPLHPPLGARARVTLADDGATLSAALDALWTAHPTLRGRVLTDDGQLRPHVSVFVERESVRYTGGLATAVGDGAVISILPAVSGG